MVARILRKLNHHRTTELYFIGYPKAGSTWVRYMLGRYVQLLCRLPDIPLFDATDRWGRCESFCAGPAMQFTHRPLLWHAQRASDLDYRRVVRPFEDKRVVLLVRHPLDVLVSLWMQRKHRAEEGYGGSLLEMLDDPVWGIEKFFRFYTLWHQHRDRVNALTLLRYEDLRADPHSAFRGLLGFLGILQQDDLLRQAVADSNFDTMKKAEAEGAGPKYRSSGLDIFATGDPTIPDAFHVRRGKVGGFADYLEPKEVERLLDLIDRRLPGLFRYSAGTAHVADGSAMAVAGNGLRESGATGTAGGGNRAREADRGSRE